MMEALGVQLPARPDVYKSTLYTFIAAEDQL